MILVLFIFVSPWYDFLLFLTDLRIIKKCFIYNIFFISTVNKILY